MLKTVTKSSRVRVTHPRVLAPEATDPVPSGSCPSIVDISVFGLLLPSRAQGEAKMRTLSHLFENNRHWADKMRADEPHFFEKLAKQQTPPYLWIGCADSRVPANQIVGLQPGEVFVHRNVANVVSHTDFNCLAVLQYAVEVLKVEHIIVCGHYGCGGVVAALKDESLGLIDNWLRHIKDVYYRSDLVDSKQDQKSRADRLCELNVAAQVQNVARTTIVQDAWRNGQTLSLHGWVYDLKDGLLRDLDIGVSGPSGIPAAYRMSR